MKHIEIDSNGNFIIDGKYLTDYLDEYVMANGITSLSDFGSLKGLLSAWSGKLSLEWENDFVWELIDSNEELNVPILVCEDDCDLSCIVIIVHIRKVDNKVYWDRIGRLDHSNWKLEEEQKNGILCINAYTAEDWEKYGDNIAKVEYGSESYWKWVNENCYEEHIRRLRNYLKPYMQKEENIEWIEELNWKIDNDEYDKMIEEYRKVLVGKL